MADLPLKMSVSGSMMTSGRVANGTLFDAAAMARIAESFVGRPFVANHERSIESAAGLITEVNAKRFRQELEVKNPDASDERERLLGRGEPEKQRKRSRIERDGKTYVRETGTRLDFTAELNANFSSYERVAGHIMAVREAGGVPNVSVSVTGEAIDYDPVVDEFVFVPAKGIHLGLVDVGALDDKTGTGVHNVEFNLGSDVTLFMEGGESFPDPVGLTATASVFIENQAEILADFCERYADQPELVQRLSDALGLTKDYESDDDDDEEDEDNKPFEEESEDDDEPSAEASYTGDSLKGTEGSDEPDEDKSMKLDADGNPIPDGETPPADAGAHDPTTVPEPVKDAGEGAGSPEPMIPLSKAKELAQLAATEAVGALRKELTDKEQGQVEAKLTERRNSIAAKFRIDAERLAVFKTAEQLDAYEADLEAVRSTPLTPNRREAEAEAKVFNVAEEYLKGRDA